MQYQRFAMFLALNSAWQEAIQKGNLLKSVLVSATLSNQRSEEETSEIAHLWALLPENMQNGIRATHTSVKEPRARAVMQLLENMKSALSNNWTNIRAGKQPRDIAFRELQSADHNTMMFDKEAMPTARRTEPITSNEQQATSLVVYPKTFEPIETAEPLLMRKDCKKGTPAEQKDIWAPAAFTVTRNGERFHANFPLARKIRWRAAAEHQWLSIYPGVRCPLTAYCPEGVAMKIGADIFGTEAPAPRIRWRRKTGSTRAPLNVINNGTQLLKIKNMFDLNRTKPTKKKI